YYNGKPWFEKPILSYWLAKPAVMLFGEAGARLPSALCLFVLLLVVGSWARRFLTDASARLAPVVLGGMILVAAIGRLMMTDVPFVLFLSLALLGAWRAYEERSAGLLALAGVGLGLASLAKGPVALVLFVPPMIYGLRALRARDGLRWTAWLGFAGAFLAVGALWYIPAYLANGPVFVQKFFIEQNVGRFTGGDKAHSVGFFPGLVFYLPILLLGTLPYTPWAFRIWTGGTARQAFLRGWIVWVFVFFTISGAKLPHYVLPLFPPLALLIAERLERSRRAFTWGGVWCGALALLLTLVQSVVYGSIRLPAGVPQARNVVGNAEAHRLIRTVRPDENLVLYRLSRRKRERGTGGTTIQETSLPSLLFVADRTIPDVESLEGRLNGPSITIFTRVDRLGPAQIASLRAQGFTEVSRETGAYYLIARFAREVLPGRISPGS
ncbi:phospholipid carrier-dependent glycosyltransferase, partial [bacterium]